DKRRSEAGIDYRYVRVEFDRARRRADIKVTGPANIPGDLAGIRREGADFWPLAMARELDDAILELRSNHPELGIIAFRSEGDPAAVLATDALLEMHQGDWFVREIGLLLKRVFKRV